MTTEQCLQFELALLKGGCRYLLELYGMEEFRIDELISHVNEIAWANYKEGSDEQ